MKLQLNTNTIVGALTLLAAIGFGLWWNANMVLQWRAHARVSEAARHNQMLAAGALLRQNAHPVGLVDSISDLTLGGMPDGTVLAGEGLGVVTPPKATQLLAWVRRGNTLIMQPRRINSSERQAISQQHDKAQDTAGDEEYDEDENDDVAPSADAKPVQRKLNQREPNPTATAAPPDAAKAPRNLVEPDSIAAQFGVRTRALAPCRKNAKPPARPCDAEGIRPGLNYLTLPAAEHRLELDTEWTELVSMTPTATAALADETLGAVRVYTLGKGHVVMLARNYFDNNSLADYDHAELLLALAKLNKGSSAVTIVKQVDALRWYVALWRNAPLLLISLAVLLALLLWSAVRRFGPLLPAPLQARRALIEHIDASGVWLWKTEGGRELLLAAAREETLALMRRRAPALLRAAPADINQAVGHACAISSATVDAALHQPASRQPLRFTSQIRTLQTLRNHYERH